MNTRPNILLILTDQHRLSALGCYGPTPCRTPNLDRLAAEGVRFETAYTCFPVCSPTRASIMTGQWPHAHGVCANVHNLGCSVHELADRPELLSRRLQAAGYRCGYTGKWHLGTADETAFGGPNTPSLPRDVGFDGQNFPGHGGGGHNYPEYKAYLQAHGWTHQVLPNERPARVMNYGRLAGPEEATVPHFLAQHTIDLMAQYGAGDQPLFLWHNFWGPHAPYYAPAAYYEQYRDVAMPEWPNYRWDGVNENRPHQVKRHPQWDALAWEDWAEAIRHYYAFTTHIDNQIGRILDYLDSSGLAEDTIVLVSADHGETLGSHGGLTDKGWHHFEEIQRIPMIVRLPPAMRSLDPGTVLEQWVSNLDIFPTVLDWAGGDAGGVHGQSFAPLVQGADAAGRETIFVEFNGVNSLATNMITCRHGDWKYGWNCSSFDELYNLAEDPYETANRIDDPACAGEVKAMIRRIEAFMEETDYPRPARSMFHGTRVRRYG